MSASASSPLLSLILCSRNDQYAGNSLWRLQTTLNYAARQVFELGREDAVEIVLTDWGSDEPLRTALALTPQAKAVTRFLEIPTAIAREKSGDSPFSEVPAHNAAIRRVAGDYIGRLDQDTLVSKRFFRRFFDLVEGGRALAWQPESAFMFVSRRAIPYAFSRRSQPLGTVCAFLERFHQFLPQEGRCRDPWFDAPTGIAVMHRNLWEECGAYDETMIYWGFMEADVAYRIEAKYAVVNLERFIGCDFYHLAHSRRRFTITDRKKNPRRRNQVFHPNGEDWGLANDALELRRAPSDRQGGPREGDDPGSDGPPGLLGMATVYAFPILAEWLWEIVLRPMRLGVRLLRLNPVQG